MRMFWIGGTALMALVCAAWWWETRAMEPAIFCALATAAAILGLVKSRMQ